MKKTGVLILTPLVLFLLATIGSANRTGELKLENRVVATKMLMKVPVSHLTDRNIEIETSDESILVSQMGEKGKVIPREKQINKLTDSGTFVNKSIVTTQAIYGPIIGISPLIGYRFPFQGCGQLYNGLRPSSITGNLWNKHYLKASVLWSIGIKTACTDKFYLPFRSHQNS